MKSEWAHAQKFSAFRQGGASRLPSPKKRRTESKLKDYPLIQQRTHPDRFLACLSSHLRHSKAFALKAATELVDNGCIARIYRIHIRGITPAGYR